MYYNAHYIHSHIAHFYALAAPDFVLGPDADPAIRNVLGVVAKVGLEIGGAVIGSRSKAQEIQRIIGGRSTQDIWCIPGGVAKGLKPEELEEIRPMVADLLRVHAVLAAALPRRRARATRPTSTSSSTDRTRSTSRTWASWTRTTRRTSTTARSGSSTSRARRLHRYEAEDYADYVAEHVEPWTYLKFPYLKQRGWKGFVEGIDSSIYCATPLARLNVAERMATPKAQEAFEEMFATLGGTRAGCCWRQHWARLVEMVQNAETLQLYCDDPEITGDAVPGDPAAGHRRGRRHRRGDARDADPSLHLRRERDLHQRQPDRRHDQQQRAHPDGDQEGGRRR